MNVGFVGLGVMGAGMAANLLRNGFALGVFARRPEQARPHLERGARAFASLEGLAAWADTVVLSLPRTGDVEAVLFDAGGLAAGLRPGCAVIDTSTVSASAIRDFARRLAAQGVDLLDAPVSGGQKGAQDGTLTCMVGGDATAFERLQPVLRGFARTVTRIGEAGAGQVCKACNQICVIASMLGAAEMVALCLKTGTDPALVRQALLGGSANSTVMQQHVLRLIDQAFAPGFRAELLLKDLRLAVQALQDAGVEAPVTRSAEPLFAALVDGGRGQLDWSAIGLLVQERSGLAPGRAA